MMTGNELFNEALENMMSRTGPAQFYELLRDRNGAGGSYWLHVQSETALRTADWRFCTDPEINKVILPCCTALIANIPGYVDVEPLALLPEQARLILSSSKRLTHDLNVGDELAATLPGMRAVTVSEFTIALINAQEQFGGINYLMDLIIGPAVPRNQVYLWRHETDLQHGSEITVSEALQTELRYFKIMESKYSQSKILGDLEAPGLQLWQVVPEAAVLVRLTTPLLIRASSRSIAESIAESVISGNADELRILKDNRNKPQFAMGGAPKVPQTGAVLLCENSAPLITFNQASFSWQEQDRKYIPPEISGESVAMGDISQ